MPRHKIPLTPPAYIGGGKNIDKAIIQKSRPMMALADYSLAELKILDLYLARIDSRNPEIRTVYFDKGEIERCLEVSQITKVNLKKRLSRLSQMVELPTLATDNSNDRFKAITLFEEADGERDADTGLWRVTLTCTVAAMKYIFNVENIGYLKYRLKNVRDLTSLYSYYLYLFLLDNRFRFSENSPEQGKIISVKELKEILHCDAETYSQYKRFNDLVLKKSQKEIEEKTDLRFTYEPDRSKGGKGRTVSYLKIEVAADEQLTFDDIQLPPTLIIDAPAPQLHDQSEDEPETSQYKDIDLYVEACDNEFTVAEVESLLTIILTIDVPAVKDGGIELARFHYLAEKYSIMKAYAAKSKIKRRYNYLRKIILKDREEHQGAKK